MSDTPDLKVLAAQALMGLLDTVKSAKDFTMEQAPDVIRQMVQFYAITSWLYVAAGVLWLLIGSSLTIYAFRSMRKSGIDRDDAGIPCIFLFPLAVVLPSCFALWNITTAICATFTPKWFIVSKLAELLK